MKKLEVNAVLAGLRLLQEMRDAGRVPEAILEVFHGDEPDVRPLTNEQIDELCQSLNFAEYHAIALWSPFEGLRLIGPFNGSGKASEYAQEAWHEGNDEPFHIVKLEDPQEDE